MKNKLKKVEKNVLKTFQQENPSTHFSNKGLKEFKSWQNNQDYVWNNLMHFPLKCLKILV